MPNTARNWTRKFVPIFFLSGVAGLAYQVVWAQGLAAAIGHEYPATLAVVTAFMLGMAAGNAVLARMRMIGAGWYGWLEVAIGVWGLMTILIIPRVQGQLVAILGVHPPALFHWLVVFVAVFTVLVPATAAMGATFPAAERFLFAVAQKNTTGLLYGANTAGAMIGALFAAFFLMPWAGIRGSILTLAVINVICGIAALLLAHRASEPEDIPRERVVQQRLPAGLVGQLVLTGLLGMGFEIAMVRALSHVLENTVFTFAAVLAVYLAGNATGALGFHFTQPRWIGIRGAPLFAGLAISCLVSGISLRWTPNCYHWLRNSLGDSIIAVGAAETITAAMLFLLPSIFMGGVWTCLVQGTLKHRPNLGGAVALNTVGAALGPVVIGLALIPTAGLKAALAGIPIAYALLAGRNRLMLITAVLCVAGIPFLISARHLVDAGGSRIFALEEGVMGTVAVLEDRNGDRVLKFNNRFQMGGTAARIAEERQADIPLLLHPGPKSALFIGLGTGITFATAANYADLRADGVELVPEIAGAMAHFNGDALEAPNLRTIVADGRRYVRASTASYDVIVADLFHPAQDGAGFLYTREHFAAIRQRLAASGLFCQWLPLHQMELSTVEIVTKTFLQVFPESHLWLLRLSIDTPVVGLIGWNGEAAYDAGETEKRIAQDERLAAHLRKVGLNDAVRLFGCYLGAARAGKSIEINTDLDPIVMFRAPAITFARQDESGERLLKLIETSASQDELVYWGGRDFERRKTALEKIEKFIQARNVYLQGMNAERKGDARAAVAAYIQSAEMSPDFTAGYAQVLTLAAALAKSEPVRARTMLEALIAAQPERPVARELLERLPK
jgi:spermidine synthase